MKLLALLMACLGLTWARELHPGIKAGVPLTVYFNTGRGQLPAGFAEYSAATRRYTAGLSLDWDFNRALGLEVDALYKRMGYVGIIEGAAGRIAFDTKGNSWEFPLLLKYRFGERVSPYVAAGPTVRYIGPIRATGEQMNGTTRTPIDTTDPSDLRKRFYPGVTAAAGVVFGHWLAELRYTRWTANIAGPSVPLRFNPNQAEVIAGFRF